MLDLGSEPHRHTTLQPMRPTPRSGMTSLDLIDQCTYSPALRAQDGQSDEHEENALKNGKKEPYEAQAKEPESDDDLGHPPQRVGRFLGWRVGCLVVHSAIVRVMCDEASIFQQTATIARAFEAHQKSVS